MFLLIFFIFYGPIHLHAIRVGMMANDILMISSTNRRRDQIPNNPNALTMPRFRALYKTDLIATTWHKTALMIESTVLPLYFHYQSQIVVSTHMNSAPQ
jgi:hypothetical protein